MDIESAASAVLDFKPTIVYPFHFRGSGGLSDVDAFKKLVNDEDASIEVRLWEWYPNHKHLNNGKIIDIDHNDEFIVPVTFCPK